MNTCYCPEDGCMMYPEQQLFDGERELHDILGLGIPNSTKNLLLHGDAN